MFRNFGAEEIREFWRYGYATAVVIVDLVLNINGTLLVAGGVVTLRMRYGSCTLQWLHELISVIEATGL